MRISRQVSGGPVRAAANRTAAFLLAAGTVIAGTVIAGTVIGGNAGASAPSAPARSDSAPPAAVHQYYLALGDSLAAGVGSPDGKGYVADVFAREHKKRPGLVLENLSCSGATTGSMINGGGCSYSSGSQLGDAEAFLTAHPGAVAFETIDIGANDVDGCTSGTSIDTACVAQGMKAISANLPVILTGLRSAGGTTPIVGMSYYDPFLAAWLLGPSGQSLATQSVGLADTLNSTLASDYGAALTADVAGAFATSDFALHGHYHGTKVPVNVGRICHWTLMCTQENIHANDIGHAHIARAFEKVLGPVLASVRRSEP